MRRPTLAPILVLLLGACLSWVYFLVGTTGPGTAVGGSVVVGFEPGDPLFRHGFRLRVSELLSPTALWEASGVEILWLVGTTSLAGTFPRERRDGRGAAGSPSSGLLALPPLLLAVAMMPWTIRGALAAGGHASPALVGGCFAEAAVLVGIGTLCTGILVSARRRRHGAAGELAGGDARLLSRLS